MLRRSKHSTIEVVAPKEEEEQSSETKPSVCPTLEGLTVTVSF